MSDVEPRRGRATRPFKRFTAPGLNTRILVLGGIPLVITAIMTTLLVHWAMRHFIENAIGDQRGPRSLTGGPDVGPRGRVAIVLDVEMRGLNHHHLGQRRPTPSRARHRGVNRTGRDTSVTQG